MVDFRVHDTFPTHPKTIGIPLAAVGLWTMAGAWSAHHLTDGVVPVDIVRPFPGWKRLAGELVARNLWREVAGGWVFVDWGQYQRTKVEVEEQRAANRVRAARARQRRTKPDDVTRESRVT
jgi:hypothetical protein